MFVFDRRKKEQENWGIGPVDLLVALKKALVMISKHYSYLVQT